MTVTDSHAQALITVALLGGSGVGKTSLAHRLLGDKFEPTVATHCLQSLKIRLDSPDGEPSTVDLVDFGDDLLHEIRRVEFSIALVVTDPCDDGVAEDIEYWTDLAEKVSGDALHTKVLVFARTDRGPPVVDLEILTASARERGFSNVIQTSALTNDGVQALRSMVNTAARVLAEEREHDESAAELVVRTLADSFCRLIAERPGFLRQVEWRDLERVLASALEAIGFEVELTSPAKDGGKDVVARCFVKDRLHTFYVEIKHWRRNRPGMQEIHDFVQVNARDRTDGGLFLSSSGFTNEVYARIGAVSRERIRLGAEEKIVTLCQKYVKSREGVWRAETPLPELLFADTLGETA